MVARWFRRIRYYFSRKRWICTHCHKTTRYPESFEINTTFYKHCPHCYMPTVVEV